MARSMITAQSWWDTMVDEGKAVPDISREYGVVRIGCGRKFHPATKDSRYGVILTCHCPGTQNGHAKVSGFYLNREANCGT